MGHLGAIWGELGAILGPFWAILGHLGAILGPSWAILGHFGASWGHLGAILGPSWAIERLLGAILKSLGAFLGPFWGPPEALLGPSWGHLGAVMGVFGNSKSREGQEHQETPRRWTNSAKIARRLGESTIFKGAGEHVEAFLRLSWAIFGPFWGHLGAVLQPSWAISEQRRSQRPQISIFLRFWTLL